MTKEYFFLYFNTGILISKGRKMLVALLLSLSSTFLDDLYNEMSMDTYPYGVDASPVLRMKNGKSPTIDSLGDVLIYGHVDQNEIVWNKNGKSSDSNFDLEFNELFYAYPRK